MATTTNGIYYPNDYDSVADIPADMKKIAESVDTKISENKTEINNIKTEQTTQNTNISNLQKDNTTNKQDITNIKAKDTEQDKYIAELEAENTRLRQDLNGLPKGQASGESIDLNDSAEMRCELKISGNSKQETRSGKNLLNFNGFATKEISGVTITNNNDGSITLNGTATANISIRLSNQMNKTLTAGNYYFSSNSKGSVSGAFTTFMFGNNDAEDIKFATITEENKGFSTSIDYKKYWLWLYINSGITFTNYIMKPQLEAGTVKTNWELYGASPSPDYPSSIQSVGDDVNELNPIAGGSQGINSSVIEGKISFSGTASTTFANITSITVGVIKKGTYIFSINEAKNYSVRLRMYYTESEYIDAIIPENKKEVVIELTNDVIKYYTYIYPLTAGTNYNDFIYEKLQKGTTVTPYSPYGQGCINEVICNKNLISIDDITRTDVGVTITKNGDTFVINGTVSASKLLVFDPSKILKVLGDYTLSVKYVSGLKSGLSYFNLRDYETNSLLLNANLATSDTSAKITIESITQIKYGIYLVPGTTFTNYTFKVQLEKGTTATDNVRHQEQSYIMPIQQPMRSIGDIRDKFIKKNNKWYERHYEVEIVVDGTETINKSSSKEFFAITKTMSNLDTSANAVNISKSNYGTGTTLGLGEGNTNNKYSFNASTIYLDCYGSNINTVDKLKAQLAETPMKIYALLKEPLDIECTEEQSTILFDIEQNAKTYDKVTHMYSTDKISSYKEVTYKKDIETLFTNTLVEGV